MRTTHSEYSNRACPWVFLWDVRCSSCRGSLHRVIRTYFCHTLGLCNNHDCTMTILTFYCDNGNEWSITMTTLPSLFTSGKCACVCQCFQLKTQTELIHTYVRTHIAQNIANNNFRLIDYLASATRTYLLWKTWCWCLLSLYMLTIIALAYKIKF